MAQLYPSADVIELPHDAIVHIEGVTRTTADITFRSNVLVSGSRIVVAAPEGTTAHGEALPIVVGQVVDTSCKRGSFVMAWYLPELTRMEHVRGGRKIR